MVKASFPGFANLTGPSSSSPLWIRDLLSIQHSMNMNTGTCVEMAGMSVTKRLYLLGNAESCACGSPKPPQDQVAPARPSQAPRKVHDLTNQISIAGGPSPDEEDNSIALDTRDPMGFFDFISEDRAFEKEPSVPSWDDSDSDSDHQSITDVLTAPEDLPSAQDHLDVPSTGGKTQCPAGKSPGTELTTSVFSHGGLMKALSPAFLDKIEREDIRITIAGLAGHEHLHHDQPEQRDPEQGPVQPPVAVSILDSAELLEQPSTGHTNVGSSRATQDQSQPLPNASREQHSDKSAESPREDDPNRAEPAFDPSASSGSLVASENASDNPSISRPVRRRNSTRPRRGVPTEEEKKRPEYQSRKYACPRPECGARFHRSDNRDRHIKSVHERNLDWICPARECAKRCTREDNGMQHLQMEHDSTCGGCGAKFNHAKGLYDHLINPGHP